MKHKRKKRRYCRVRVREVPFLRLDGRPSWGVYWGKGKLTGVRGPVIELEKYQPPQEFLNSVIHEFLHHFIGYWSEKKVTYVATAISKVLWKRGFRRIAR